MSGNGSGLQAAGIGDYLGWLVRRWWLVAIIFVVCVVIGGGYAAIQPKAYDSTTSVLVQDPTGDTAKNALNLDTEAQIVQSVAVASGAQKLMGTQISVRELLSAVTVVVPANTSVLDITFEASTPKGAETGSQDFAQAYLDQRAAVAQASVNSQISHLQDKITSLNNQLNKVSGQLATLPSNSQERAQAESSSQILQSQIKSDQAALSPLQAIIISPGTILSGASTPSGPSKPQRSLYLAGGGLMLGLAAALAMARLDTRIYGSKDVPERPDVPVLMEIRPGRQRPMVADAATALGREFSLLRNVLRFAAGAARGGRPSTTDTLLVCGAVPGPATGFTVANLAAAFARSGERVVIVCTDPDSSVPEILGVRSAHGLGEVLAGELTLDEALATVPSMRDVKVLTSGQLDPRLELPVAVVSELLHKIQQGTDRVLVAASAPSSKVDAQALSEVAAAVLLVVETNRAHTAEVDAALDQFARVYAPVAGMLVVSDHWKFNRPTAEKRTIGMPALPVARPRMALDAPIEGDLDEMGGLDDEAAPAIAPSRQLNGFQNRGADQTMILPRATDVEDPPTSEWPAPSKSMRGSSEPR
jgi:polysaccharide biosynthesis transport protein